MSFNKKILVVDDEPHVRILLKSRLEANGYAVVTAYGGTQALEKVKEEKPDLILLDIVMPDLNGYEVAQRLKSDPETAALPIIIFTASNIRELEDKCRDLGVDYVIMKPFSPEVMLGMVKELFKKNES
ncbi:MAG: response regulator [Elusimicrobia bacterium]|nr:response regulator [Elusimicrobiota bacterium]